MEYEEMTVQEAAASLGVSVPGIQRRIQRGDMKARRVGARVYVIPRAEVERWRQLGKRRPGPKKGSKRARPQ